MVKCSVMYSLCYVASVSMCTWVHLRSLVEILFQDESSSCPGLGDVQATTIVLLLAHIQELLGRVLEPLSMVAWRARSAGISQRIYIDRDTEREIHTERYIYICVVKLLSGPSVASLIVIIW